MSGKQKIAFAEKMHKNFSLLFTRFDSEQKKLTLQRIVLSSLTKHFVIVFYLLQLKHNVNVFPHEFSIECVAKGMKPQRQATPLGDFNRTHQKTVELFFSQASNLKSNTERSSKTRTQKLLLCIERTNKFVNKVFNHIHARTHKGRKNHVEFLFVMYYVLNQQQRPNKKTCQFIVASTDLYSAVLKYIFRVMVAAAAAFFSTIYSFDIPSFAFYIFVDRINAKH